MNWTNRKVLFRSFEQRQWETLCAPFGSGKGCWLFSRLHIRLRQLVTRASATRMDCYVQPIAREKYAGCVYGIIHHAKNSEG